MRRKLFRVMLGIIAIQIIGAIVGTIVSRKLTRGDEDSDDFQVAAVFGGKQFRSHADHLKSGTVIASLGGVELDLRDATIDSEGATLELKATMGGVQAIVPEGWAVDVDETATAGGVEVKVTPLEDLPEDAPKLHIDATARMGGVLVATKEA
ncbi:MAG: LiaF domain-containing protein [Acidimicrobiia bacterium]